MLYVTTRNKTDSYTDYRTLVEDMAPNGGFFIPFRVPQLDENQLRCIKEKTFGQTVADILNLFYAGRITSWDVDCNIGKMPVKIVATDHRLLLAKLWDNSCGSYDYLRSKIYQKLCDENKVEITQWASIAIRISVLFGVYNILQKNEIKSFDICVNTGDFSDPMAAWYARYMGLPIRKIICTCDDSSPVWDFIHRGEFNTSLVNAVPGIERLICAELGFEYVQKYLDACKSKGTYYVPADLLPVLNKDIFVSVVGKERADSVVGAFYAANKTILDPCTAFSYGGLQDYRAKTGESIPTVLLWDFSPVQFSDSIQKATGLTLQDIKKHIDKY